MKYAKHGRRNTQRGKMKTLVTRDGKIKEGPAYPFPLTLKGKARCPKCAKITTIRTCYFCLKFMCIECLEEHGGFCLEGDRNNG